MAGVLLNIAPGTDTFYIISRSISQGTKAGVVSALGVCSGAVCHTLFAALGLSVILTTSATLFFTVKLAVPSTWPTWVACCSRHRLLLPLKIKKLLTHTIRYEKFIVRESLPTCSTPKLPCFSWLSCLSLSTLTLRTARCPFLSWVQPL